MNEPRKIKIHDYPMSGGMIAEPTVRRVMQALADITHELNKEQAGNPNTVLQSELLSELSAHTRDPEKYFISDQYIDTLNQVNISNRQPKDQAGEVLFGREDDTMPGEWVNRAHKDGLFISDMETRAIIHAAQPAAIAVTTTPLKNLHCAETNRHIPADKIALIKKAIERVVEEVNRTQLAKGSLPLQFITELSVNAQTGDKLKIENDDAKGLLKMKSGDAYVHAGDSGHVHVGELLFGEDWDQKIKHGEKLSIDDPEINAVIKSMNPHVLATYCNPADMSHSRTNHAVKTLSNSEAHSFFEQLTVLEGHGDATLDGVEQSPTRVWSQCRSNTVGVQSVSR